ncbi:hypothetical protein DYB25_006116 [Aphanomyces astaci]|uniref:Uncharacterized protein n=1 Tax=Aphanomyces astaci TaxID=112090 RepID=A0A397EVM4_APHAT|nr:hypothetical protein DYB36_008087 [Aphanomyces astaci]RHY21142.1 hypothetical protein DYB25_006116 [Aphanomyces astaci]RHY43669.1 hypothetical protein DYB38_003588 [Aphanomyces astaci]RHY67912.1 hypothetical protein DYB34_004404 [Aphanomyces astaci]RHY69371.1 hypothetical protein DYB30_006614 [Aphanomyces astaci]
MSLHEHLADWTDDPLVSASFAPHRRRRDGPSDLPPLPHAATIDLDYAAKPSVNVDVSLGAHIRDTLLDLYAATVIFVTHLMGFESVLVLLVSVGATSGYYYMSGTPSTTDPPSPTTTHRFSANLSWILITFAVVSPMIMQIKQAFLRRENALDNLADLKAIASNVLLANVTWNWGDNHRAKLPPGHNPRAKLLLRGLMSDLYSLLKLPTFTRGRHRLTTRGMDLAVQYQWHVDAILERMMVTIQQLHMQVERMKALGLPPNEASRINQYHWFLQARIERLCNIKMYRTPQATRSFTRLFILILPFFYGPYYIYLIDSGDGQTSFAFALVLSAMTSITMIGIFNVEKALEDPFTEEGLDGVQIDVAIHRIFNAFDAIYPTS